MACCCKYARGNKASAACLGRCDLPKHRCLLKEEVKPGPIPKHMGWLYTARDGPQHQLRCGWRPGHISCEVLQKIEAHKGKCGECTETCTATCSRPHLKPCGIPPKCSAQKGAHASAGSAATNEVCPTCPPPCCKPIDFPPRCKAEAPTIPYLRIVRHGGQYAITTEPTENSPSGPYPLKYVFNCDPNEKEEGAKFSVEAKYNDYCFDYTSSQTSFVLDFSPPDARCLKPCPKDPCGIICTQSCLPC